MASKQQHDEHVSANGAAIDAGVANGAAIDAGVADGAAVGAADGAAVGVADGDLLTAPAGGGRSRARRLVSLFFVGAGVNHFLIPRAYRQIVPPWIGDESAREAAVTVSGVAEIAGGLGVLAPATRRLSGLGLIALLVAVFPANLYMARNPEHFRRIPTWALYARLPLQPLMAWWVWRATRREPA